MIRIVLRKGDGLSSGRIWLRSVVKPVQAALTHAGHALKADGQFGSGTERVVKAFQTENGLPESGIVDRAGWESLSDHLNAALADRLEVIAELMPDFDGDLGWVHEQEGHNGKPYWPGGESGVTLDPGMDLGHGSAELVEKLYRQLVTPEQYAALEKVFGVKGEDANRALKADPTLRQIRITSDQADEIMPHTAKPYWDGIVRRFSSLPRNDTVASVQTVLLSLAYNRGTHNRDLEQLRAPLDAKKWAEVADRVGSMQQNHQLEGIRIRRRREAQFIGAELEYLQG